jgi:hypothetical protein
VPHLGRALGVDAVVDRADVDLECDGGQREGLATAQEGHDFGVDGAVTHAKITGVTPP